MDGSGGWGPRFLVPLVPVLAAAAGAATASSVGRAAGAGLLALGIGVNALGTFESEAATFFYVSSTGLAGVSPELYAEYPASFRPPGERTACTGSGVTSRRHRTLRSPRFAFTRSSSGTGSGTSATTSAARDSSVRRGSPSTRTPSRISRRRRR